MAALSFVHEVRRPRAGALSDGVRPPLLVLLHGVGANEQQMSPLMPAFDPRLVVVSVRSPIAIGPGAFAWFHVNFAPDGPRMDVQGVKAAWERVPAIIDELVQAYDLDATRVYVAGFSQGGIVALAALLSAPQRISGVAVMSGRLLPEVLPYTATPNEFEGNSVLLVHGVHDDKLGIAYAREAKAELERLPIALTYREVEMGHTFTPESIRVVTRWVTARLDGGVGVRQAP